VSNQAAAGECGVEQRAEAAVALGLRRRSRGREELSQAEVADRMPEPAVSSGMRRRLLEYGHAVPWGPCPHGCIPQLMPISPSQTISAVELIVEEPATVELFESYWEHDRLHARISHVATD
jgi:hypothetical protein